MRNFTAGQLAPLLDFVESSSAWGNDGRELGRRTFEQTLGQPGLAPEDNCFILEENRSIQGYCLVFPEPTIGRVVLEPKISQDLIGSGAEQELMLQGIDRAESLTTPLVHVCVPDASLTTETTVFLRAQGFVEVRNYWDMIWKLEHLPPVAPPEGFSVRSFRTGDAALLTEVQNSAFAASWGFCPNTVDQIGYRSSMANTSHQGIVFLSEGDTPAGYCWTVFTPADTGISGMIGMIGVVPDYQGQGISSAVLVAGMEYLRSQQVVAIGLQVDRDNTPGVRLYRSVGFQKVGELHWFERGPR